MFNPPSSRGRRRESDSSFYYETPSDRIRGDRAIYLSTDGRRATTNAFNISHKKARVGPEELAHDPYADWNPVPETGLSDWDTERANLEGDGTDMPDDEEEGAVHYLVGGKRKRQVPPNHRWRPMAQTFLDEMMRAEGLGDALSDPRCGTCTSKPEGRMFRCADCGTYVQCEGCVVRKHTLEPLHRLKVWNGTYWQPITLKDLKIMYQLGHGGLSCPVPDSQERAVVVIHTNGLHTVDYRECGCDARVNNLRQFQRNSWYPATVVNPATCATNAALDLFRLLNVVGNISVHDFVGTLERLTDATRVTPVPDRYKGFGYMWRQYAFMTRAKRHGRGNDPEGLESTANGGLAEDCWTCPLDGKNIPADWRDVAPEFRFLYMLILAVDANFRLKNRIRENEISDPSFGSGWGYFVKSGPYKEHLRGYVAEKDVSTCIAFAALMQKDTRTTTGLRCSGVGGVVCARHEVVRPQGMGDLQKGERYSNMDYIFWSSIIGVMLLYVVVSYDIACQWRINLKTRKEKMPPQLKNESDSVTLGFGLPVWHAAAHERECQAQNSLTYMPGVGRTDGEGIERTWSGLNPAAWSTKEMGEGARHDALEDRIDHHNWEKNISQGSTLARRLVVAMEEEEIQVAAFEEVDRTLSEEVKHSWQDIIDAWMKDKTKPNPYVLPNGGRSGPSETQVRLELKRDEMRETGEIRDVRRRGATAFLVAGMQLEDLQRSIRMELKGRTLLVADQDGRIAELRLSFEEKLYTFRKLQARHMPGVVSILEDEEDRRDSDLPPAKPEDTKLWMPSELTTTVRNTACAKGLAEREVKLRACQCTNAVDNVRARLYAKRHLLLHSNSGVGQRHATRANTLLGEIQERVEATAEKYRQGRRALMALKGVDYCAGEFPEMRPEDLVLEEKHDKDSKARHKLAMIGSTKGRHRNAPSFHKEKKQKKNKKKPRPVMSWIWTATGAPDEDEVALHASVRVEWGKAQARKCRWTEEVLLLREEMKRVLRYLRWKAAWWEGQRGARRNMVAADILAGVDAYAARQAASCRAIARRFKQGWDASKSDVVKTALADDALFVASMASFVAATAEEANNREGDAHEDEGHLQSAADGQEEEEEDGI